jgi:hypothetical protein
VASIDPAVEAYGEPAGHAMCVVVTIGGV